jgi:hypothetical protein
MDNVPVNVNGPASTGRNASQPLHKNGHVGKQKTTNPKKRMVLITSLVALLVIALGGWFLYQSSTAATIDNSKYQAVFFTNGQVYFGKLKTLNSNYMKLSNIFYLQAQNTTPTTDSKNPQQTTAQQSNDVQLVKLGSEVHGPDDEMIISKDQILFFENLKKDGKVSASIATYQHPK